MSFNILDSDFNDFLSVKDKPIAVLEAMSVAQTKLISPKGNIHYKEHHLGRGLSILESQYCMDDEVTITGQGEQSILEIQINLSESAIYYRDKQNRDQSAASKSAKIAFLAAEDNKAKIYLQKDVNYNTFDIHLPITLLEHFQGESSTFDQFLKTIGQDISCDLSRSVAISPAIFGVITDIRQCKYEGLTRRIYLESKIFELIAFLYQDSTVPAHSTGLSTQDRIRMEEAAMIIANNLDQPFTIIQLAKHVGVNQTKLKNDFKLAYGNTIFGYLQDLRMKEAKRYLLDTTLSIQEISMRLGYQNMSNFSIAFKKSMGYSPNKLRVH
jgi:AraC-type DNA-binding domain-containing proteins